MIRVWASGLSRALLAIALAGVAASAAATALTLASDHEDHRALAIVAGLLIAWSFIGTGLYAWWRRPHNRFGALMTATGFAWLLGALMEANSEALFTLGVLLGSLYFAVFGHMVLAYPDGRLRTAFQRRLVAAGYAIATLGPLPYVLVGDIRQEEPGCDCPQSAIRVSDDESLRQVLVAGVTILAVAFVAAALAILVRRWRDASRAQRRGLAPVLWSGVVLLALLAGSLTSETIGAADLSNALGVAGLVAFVSTPWAFLFGLLRSRVSRASAVSELLLRIGTAPRAPQLRGLLADALHDDSLALVYWLEDRGRWVDAEGRPAELPAEDDPRLAWTAVELEGRRVGAVVHDRTLREDPDLVRSVATAAALAMENERLEAQLRARVEELRLSRQRLIEAGMAERRRLERNLHDGAQQRLVALSLTLRLAQARVAKDPEGAHKLLAGAQDELGLALAELRELARGIHPAVLSDRGLPAALDALVGRSPVPVAVAELPGERLPPPVEAAAYYVVAEALTNIVKYAHASAATVRVARQNGHALVEVSDDGVGGADPGHGSGLRGLADRVAALDGHLSLDSPPGAGTRLRVEIPV
jgi:signal transduction histidine kinase